MVARSAHRRPARVRSAGRQAAGSRATSTLARAGLAARRIMYGLIGVISVQMALALVTHTPLGPWLLGMVAPGLAGGRFDVAPPTPPVANMLVSGLLGKSGA
jgi:hypothetical protein